MKQQALFFFIIIRLTKHYKLANRTVDGSETLLSSEDSHMEADAISPGEGDSEPFFALLNSLKGSGEMSQYH